MYMLYLFTLCISQCTYYICSRFVFRDIHTIHVHVVYLFHDIVYLGPMALYYHTITLIASMYLSIFALVFGCLFVFN